jgi:Flp pilus assembly protein TadD
MKTAYNPAGRWMRSILLCLLSFILASCTYKNPRTTEHLIRYGVKLAEAGYWKEACKQWEMVLVDDPENVAALNNLAVVSELSEDSDTARSMIDKANALRPDDNRIEHNMKEFLKRSAGKNAREKADEKNH